eukprot:2620464-Rhodomonas_salina.1
MEFPAASAMSMRAAVVRGTGAKVSSKSDRKQGQGEGLCPPSDPILSYCPDRANVLIDGRSA